MIAIVCADLDWGIAKDGKQHIMIRDDLKRFKAITTRGSNSYVIMGANTFRNLPGVKPLKGRTNVVLSHTVEAEWVKDFPYLQQYLTDGSLKFVPSTGELSHFLLSHPINIALGDDWFVIGGGQIYKALLPGCDAAYVTRVGISDGADTFFPNLDADIEWTMCHCSEWKHDGNVMYRNETYVRVSYMTK